MAHVLVVDDDPLVRGAVEAALQNNGFEVAVADFGAAGLASTSFDAMLVDILMPRMRGLEAIRRFHERAPSIPLIAMSGYAFANIAAPSPDFHRMAFELGASHCLRKPFSTHVLLSALNECLAGPRAE
jgi:CheY-like chemotaxis protein